MSKRMKVVLGVGLLVAIVLVVIFAAFRKKKDMTVKVEKGDVVEAVYGIGTVTANRSYKLKLGIGSTIQNIYVKEGDSVKKGDPLVLFSDTPLFKAPFDGTVVSVNYKIGETVSSQSEVLSLVDFKDRYIVVNLEQNGAVRVQRGQKARMTFEGMKDALIHGAVDSVFSREGSFMVRLNAPMLPSALLPGMTLDVAIEIQKKPGVLLAPASALNRETVTLVQGAKRSIIPIKVGIVDGEKFEILPTDGAEVKLQEGDLLLIGGGK